MCAIGWRKKSRPHRSIERRHRASEFRQGNPGLGRIASGDFLGWDAGTKTLAEIPKIAQRRLQNEQLGAEVAHPDADLLTAFAEQALPARERDQVLAHLARCADCREIAALAGAAVAEPELVAAPKQVDHKPSRSFWSLRPLRWTAAAATAAVVLSAVWLNRKEVTRQELPAGTETNPAIVQQQNEPARCVWCSRDGQRVRAPLICPPDG